MTSLFANLLVLLFLSLVHSIVLTPFLSPTLGDFWPTFRTIFVINLLYCIISHWITEHLKGNID